MLRQFIAEEILAKTPDPAEEIAKLKGEMATLSAEADRLLDIATPANRDFVDERLGKIRARRRDIEDRLADLERVDCQLVDLEDATGDALAHLAKFREVLQEGTLEQRKEFLRGFVAEIGIDPDKARGTITYYELPVLSLMSVATYNRLRVIDASGFTTASIPSLARVFGCENAARGHPLPTPWRA